VAGISQLNVVVQQGRSAPDVHHIKQQTIEHTQMIAAEQEAIRETDLKGKVPESETSDKLGLKREKPEGQNDGRQSEEEKKKKKREKEKEMAPTGKFLDTVA